MWPAELMHNELRPYRLSRTAQREQVYYFVGAHGPLKRAGLVKLLADKVDRATVYRTVKAFLATRVVRELPGGLIELSPPFRQQHYDIICRGCGRRAGFWDPKLETMLNRILERRKYVLPAHQVELSGLCLLCAEQI